MSGRGPTTQVEGIKSVSLAQVARTRYFGLRESPLYHLITKHSIHPPELITFALIEGLFARYLPDEPRAKFTSLFFPSFFPP